MALVEARALGGAIPRGSEIDSRRGGVLPQAGHAEEPAHRTGCTPPTTPGRGLPPSPAQTPIGLLQLAVLLAFDCYLRVGELVGLQVG